MIGETFSHYRITDKLGEGGMGEVWRAEDTQLGREVAIKVLPEAFAQDTERMARFEREARVLAALDHPHIAAIYGLEEAEGRKLLVMQLAEGENLQEMISRGQVPLKKAVKIAVQIAEALEAAHDKGIIHRDLKPANVKVSSDGQVKVLDFGLAKALDPGDPNSSGSGGLSLSPTLTAQMTEAGVLLGTAAYMSPEQARGDLADRRADIWAFGIVLMEMLTGKTVYAGRTVSDTLAGVLAREPEWQALPEDTPLRIRKLLERCLEKEMPDRLQAIGEARIALQQYLAHPETEATAETAPIAASQPTWKRLLPWALFAAAAAGLIAALVALWPEPPRPKTPIRFEAVLAEDPLFVNLGASVVLSPDVSRLVYVTDGESNRALFTRSLDQLAGTELVVGSNSNEPYHPFFSPDGQWVGFAVRNELKKVPITGGTPITLCEVDGSRGASWGPDDTIALSPGGASEIHTVSAAGGTPEKLTTFVEERKDFSHRWPQFTPDGKAVIYTVGYEGMSTADQAIIEAISLETGEQKVIHEGGYYARYVPSGHLVFIRDGTLFGMPFDVASLEPTGSPSPLVQGITTDNGPAGAQFSFSSDGTLAYVSGEVGVPTYPIVWVDKEGKSTTLWDTRGSYGEPSLSPDGKKLGISVLRDGQWDVWVYDLEREVATRLTFHDGYDADQAWTPDGRYLIFTSNRDGIESIYRKRADGSGEVERLIENEEAFYPFSVSGDGKFLAGEISKGGNLDLYILPLDGSSEPEVFLASEFDERYPDFSPDGRWIAYSSNESGRYEVYVRPYPAAGGKWQVSDGGGAWPLWSGDGRRLFYRTNSGIMEVSVEASGESLSIGTPTTAVEGPFRGGMFGISVGGYIFGDYDVSPDGERFVMFPEDTDVAPKTHVTMVFNWFDELERTLPTGAK
jgi:Tol biopolymer transport system component